MGRLSQSRCLYWGAITIVHHCVLLGPSHGRVQGNKPQLTVTSPPFFCQDRPHWYSKPSLSLTKSGFFSSFLEYAIENLFRQTISHTAKVNISQNTTKWMWSLFILHTRPESITYVLASSSLRSLSFIWGMSQSEIMTWSHPPTETQKKQLRVSAWCQSCYLILSRNINCPPLHTFISTPQLYNSLPCLGDELPYQN